MMACGPHQNRDRRLDGFRSRNPVNRSHFSDPRGVWTTPAIARGRGEEPGTSGFPLTAESVTKTGARYQKSHKSGPAAEFRPSVFSGAGTSRGGSGDLGFLVGVRS